MAQFPLRYAFGLLAVSLTAGCASTQPQPTVLFAEPESLDGMTTAACGHLFFGFENHNFYPNARDARRDLLGVGVAPGETTYDQLRSYHNKRVCLAGRVRYSGCTETYICTGSNFPYEIVVDDVKIERK